MAREPAKGWWLLIHQLPARPAYLRVRIGRALAKIGAVTLKNAVYVLPGRPECRAALRGLRSEIIECGGEGMLVSTTSIEGISDRDLQDLFRAGSDRAYRNLAAALTEAVASLPSRAQASARQRQRVERCLAKARSRLAAIALTDFFGASGRGPAEAAIHRAEAWLAAGTCPGPAETGPARVEFRGRTWITRKGVFVDRMACAWLVRRFIDPEARFGFVGTHSHQAEAGQVTYDMEGADFGHEGDRCSFEVLAHRFVADDPAVGILAEIIHDLDLRDGRYSRPEAAGLMGVLAGIAAREARDPDRLARSGEVLDGLYEHLRRGAVPGRPNRAFRPPKRRETR